MGDAPTEDLGQSGVPSVPAAATSAAPRDRLVSPKRLIQAGSLAAALASILGLALMVGDRVTGAFRHEDGAPRARIESVSLETMSLRTFLVAKKHGAPLDGYAKKELGARVLVVDIRAQLEHSIRGVSFPVMLTLERRRDDGDSEAIDQNSEEIVLDKADDRCGCSTYFPLPARGGEYRVEMQILPPNAPTSDPLDERASDWRRL